MQRFCHIEADQLEALQVVPLVYSSCRGLSFVRLLLTDSMFFICWFPVALKSLDSESHK